MQSRRRAAPAVDDALLDRARTDPEAFAELYVAYAGLVFSVACRRLGSRQGADDVTAATFERAWRAMPNFQPRDGGFPAWLLRIASNQVTDHIRRESRHRTPRAQRALSVLAQVEPVAEPGMVIENDDPTLRAALDRIRPRYAEALTLRYLAGLSSPEAAAQLGCSGNTFAVLLRRAKAALRRELEADGGDPELDRSFRDGSKEDDHEQV